MRLDFNVLWIEDLPDNVQSQRERIELLLEKEGFRLQVRFASSIEEAKMLLSDGIYGDHIDLILMDYDLGAGTRGDDGLVEVRNKFYYKDIIFYSSQAGQLENMVAQKRVQGVFCSTRIALPDVVEGVFEALVKKVLDIDHSRGIVMGATSDIDYHVDDCLIAVFEKCGEEDQSATLRVLLRHLEEKRKDFEKHISELKALTNLSTLSEEHNKYYTSNDRLKLLLNALKIAQLHEDKAAALREYMTSVVPKRNLLAHHRVEVEGFSRKLVDRQGKEFTGDDMKALRLELIRHQALVEQLSEAVRS